MTGPPADIVIITGMSGAGKSTTAKSLEDLDWYVIDNLPPGLLPTMADLAMRGNRTPPRIAAVIDLRERQSGGTAVLISLKQAAIALPADAPQAQRLKLDARGLDLRVALRVTESKPACGIG